MLESTLQTTIFTTISHLYPEIKFISSMNGLDIRGPLSAITVNGKRIPKEEVTKAIGKIVHGLKKQGSMLKGEADFRLLLPKGITLNIELKVKDNVQQTSQIEYEQDLKELGHHYAVCYSLSQTLAIINEHLDVEYRQECLEAYRGDLPTIMVKEALNL